MRQSLSGYWAVVTGASSGIGEAYARELAVRGVNLVLTARREDRLRALGEGLVKAHGISYEPVPLDIGKPGAAEKLFAAATAHGRKVGILINNAGLGRYGRFLGSDLSRHTETIAVNIAALTELSHRFGEHMAAQSRPCWIGNVASVAGFQGTPRFAVYSGSKFYVRVFSEILDYELRDTQVSVSCLCPGGTETEFLEANNQVLKGRGRGAMMTAEAVARAGLDGMLAGKAVVVPGLINKMACFLPRLFPRPFALSLAEKAMGYAIEEKNA